MIHVFQQLLELRDLFVGDLAGRQRRRLAFEQQSRFGEFERGNAEVDLAAARSCAHIGPRAEADLDQPLHLQRDDGLADRRAADVEVDRQFALGGKAVAHGIAAAGDGLEQAARHGLVQPVAALGRACHSGGNTGGTAQESPRKWYVHLRIH